MALLLGGMTIAVIDMAIPEHTPIFVVTGEPWDRMVVREFASASAEIIVGLRLTVPAQSCGACRCHVRSSEYVPGPIEWRMTPYVTHGFTPA
jgi:hypothetical protein